MAAETIKLDTRTITTPLGSMTARANDLGITDLFFAESGSNDTANTKHDLLDKLERQLQEYFSGERRTFDIPLAPKGTAFQQRVWSALLDIPYGSTISYMEQSKLLGDAKAIRAVAAANGRNPVAILIPCHRVIGSNGALTGYAGGIDRKKSLLLLESPQPTVGLWA